MGGQATRQWDDTYEQVIRPHLPKSAGRRLETDDLLADLGLDSLEVIQLLLDIEGGYNIAFPDELLTAETFQTVGSLWQVITDVVGEQRGEA